MGQWVFGAGLMGLVALAHAQPANGSHFGGGGLQRTPMVSPASGGAPRGGMSWAGRERGAWGAREAGPLSSGYRAGNGDLGRSGPMRVADQGGWHERGGRSARSADSQPGRAAGGGNGTYHGGPITPVSEQMHPVPHPPADSPVRAGSIREDVARYNEERGSFRPLPRGGDVPHPPMPSPYRN
jgi:hypothetical protein